MCTHRISALAFSLVLLLGAGGGADAAIPLMSALAKTYLENPRLLAARAELEAADEDVTVALSGFRPSVTLMTEAALDRMETSDQSADLRTLDNSFTISQPLYTGGRVSAAVKRAEAQVQTVRAGLEVVEQEVLLAAVDAYLGLDRAQKALTFGLENETRAASRLAEVRERYRFGELTGTDVAQAEARAAEATAERTRLEAALRAAGAEYQRIIGDPPGTLAPTVVELPLPQSLDEARDLASLHPLLRMAEHEEEVARGGVAVADKGLAPRLGLTAEARHVEDPAAELARQSDLKIAARLTIPLYRGGAAYAAMRQARHQRRARQQDVRAAARAVEAELVTAYELLASERARTHSLELRRHAAELALAGLREEALLGARSVSDVLDGERELFEAELELNATRSRETVAEFRLLAATGNLTARAIGLDATIYDPEVYYRETRGRWFGSDIGDRATGEEKQVRFP